MDSSAAALGTPPGALGLADAPRLWVRVGAQRVEGSPAPPEAAAHRPTLPGTVTATLTVEGRGGLSIELAEGEPGARVLVQVGRLPLQVRLDAQGAGRATIDDALEGAAGRLRVALVEPRGPRVDLDVHPLKLDGAQVRALLAELDALAPGLGADLGGRAEQVRGASEAQQETAEARLARLERAVGLALSASGALRHQPLCTVREVAHAVPTPGGAESGGRALAAADVRWLARAPAALRAQAIHPQVGVRRSRTVSHDLPENRGVVGLLKRLEHALDEAAARIELERDRIEAGRAARTRFRTADANLFDELDRPRLLGCDQRAEHIARLRDDVGHARWRTGLPPTLPAAPRLLRSADVEARRGYWLMYQAQEALEGVGPVPPEARFAPVASLDELYELWCVVQVVGALAAAAGLPLGQVLRLSHDGWFVQVPEGEVARLVLPDGRRLTVLRGPRYGFRPVGEHTPPRPGDPPLVRLGPGGPLWPDLVVQEDGPPGAEVPSRLHVFDAKHRLDRHEPDQCPWSSLLDLWLKYGEGIGHRSTGLPAVAAVWVLYPGQAAAPRLASPAMLQPAWPEDRLRGGAVPLSPGHTHALRPVVAALLRLNPEPSRAPVTGR